jgi:hypothetical protein
MKSYNRELLVMLKTSGTSEQEIEKQLAQIHSIAQMSESRDAFCQAHELVKRFRITQKKRALLDTISEPELKPFYFLINKN